MPRVKTGTVRRKRHKKILKQAKGFYSGRRKHFRKAKEQVEHALVYAYRDRRQKKRDFRKLWIIRINAACKLNGLKYSQFMFGLKLLEIELDRKILASMAMENPESSASLTVDIKNELDIHNTVTDEHKPLFLDKPKDEKPCDLKEISGIGEEIEKLLNKHGVFHLSQIASWNENNLRWIDKYLKIFKGRAKRDDWVGQAKVLNDGGETEFSKRVKSGEVYK